MKKSRVAFLTPFSPHRADSGGTQVSLQRLKALCEVADVDVFSLYDVSEAREALRAQAPIHELYQAGSLRGRNLVNFLRSVVSGLPLSVWRNSEPTFLRMAELHGTEVYDVIYIDHWLMWSAAKHFTAAKRRILHLHNAEHLLFSRAKEGKSALLRGVLSWEASRAAAFLVKIAAACDETHFLSPVDQAALIKLGVRENTTRAFFPAVDVHAEEFCKEFAFFRYA